jgi:regulator of nonsense transcripts 3
VFSLSFILLFAGNEYPAIVEFCPFQKIPKKKPKKPDSRKGTIEEDSDYKNFLENLNNPNLEPAPSVDSCLEEIEARERERKGKSRGCRKTILPSQQIN